MHRVTKELGRGVGLVSGKVFQTRECEGNARVDVCDADSGRPSRPMKENGTTGDPQFWELWCKFQRSGAGSS